MSGQTLKRGGYVGSRVRRVEDARLVTGRGQFTDDIHLPGMLHAAFLRSPYPHARITSIDATAAERLPGVVKVFVGDDLKGVLGDFETEFALEGVPTVTRPPLDSRTARFVGQPLAAVVATSRYIAEDGVDEILLEAEPLPPVMTVEDALAPDAVLLRAELGTNNLAHLESQTGDVDAIFASAARVFSHRLEHGRHMGAPLETRAVIAQFDAGTGELKLWSSSQIPHLIRSNLAGPLGLPENKIQVICPSVGGGFGLKAMLFDEEAILPAISRLLSRPVKWIEDRYEHLAASMHAKHQVCDIEVAVDEDGKFLAFRGDFIGVAGAWPAHPWSSLVDPLCAATLLPGLYDIQAVGWRVDQPMTNRCPTGPYRGIGWTAGHTTMQILLDEVAHELGVDPVDLRLKNLIPSEPFVSITGMRYDGGSYRECVEKVREMLDYDAVRARQAELREQGQYVGVGISPYIEPTAWGSQLAAAQGFPYEFFDQASVTVEPDGSVTVTTGLHSHGQSHQTVFAQVAADVLGVRMEDVRIRQGDSDSAVYGNGTYASRSGVIAAGSIMRAGGDIKRKMLEIAAHMLEVSPDDVELHEGIAQVSGVPSRRVSVADIADVAYYGGDRRPEGMEQGLTATRPYDPPETYSNGAFGAIVVVDVETGEIKIERIAACDDCGRRLNPMVIDGQVHGAVAQGLGGALYEEIIYDGTGQLLSGTLLDYLYPTAAEVPEIDTESFETPSVATDGGVKGIGECGTIAAGPAVVSAIIDALRPFGPIKVTKTPITPNDVLDLIDQAKQQAVG